MKAASISDGRIEVGFTEHGGLASLRDLEIDREYVAPPREAGRPLFRITLAEARGDRIVDGEIVITSMQATIADIVLSGTTARLRFERIDGIELDAECIASLDHRRGFTRWRILVVNRTPFAIRCVEFPIVCAHPQLGASAVDDRFLLPRYDGCLVGNPRLQPWEDSGREVDHQRFFYPGDGREFPSGMSAQVIAYYDPGGGLYVATHDGEGHPKKLGPLWVTEAGGELFDLSPVHYRSEIPGSDFECSYDTVIGCFRGDWQDAADIYKEWARTQAWCRARTAERTDIPEWVKKGAFFFNFRLRSQEGGESYLERVPDYLERWQAVLEAPLVAMMCGWEKIGEWTGPDYFPPYGGERFSRMCAELAARRIRPFPFGLSGLKLAIRKRISRFAKQPELAVDYDARDEFEAHLKVHAALSVSGTPLLDSSIGAWDGLHSYACVATPQAREQLYGATMHLVREHHAVVSQADQLFGGGVTECYSTSHGHPPGRGRWQVEALRAIYRDLRRDAKQLDPDFVLSQEFQSELFLQELDVYHGRNYDQPRGLVGVPLFSYLYHEYLPCYGGDWSSFLADNTCGVYNHASNFVNGNLPAGCPQTMWNETRNHEPEDADPAILQMAKNATAAALRNAKYLLLGEMLKTIPLDVPDIEVAFVGLNFGWSKRSLAVPKVLHRAWRAPDGDWACAFANISSENIDLAVPVAQFLRVSSPEPGSAGPPDRSRANVYLNRNGDEPEMIASGIPDRMEITLAPQDAAVIVAR